MIDIDLYIDALRYKYDKAKEKAISNNDLLLANRIDKRFEHSLGVLDKAVELVETHHLDVNLDEVRLAALLHDYAKFVSREEFEEALKEANSDEKYDEKYEKIMHAILGPYIIQRELNVNNPNVLNAIKTHSSGCKNMTTLQELIYLSDCVEENREGEFFAKLRKIANRNFKKAIAIYLKDEIDYLLTKERPIHPYTMEAFMDYKKYLTLGDTLYEKVLSALNHNLLENVRVYNTKLQSPLYDYVIVSSTNSKRQMDACISYLKDDFDVRGVEHGEDWTLIDLNDVILHIFLKEARDEYAIDKLYVGCTEVDINGKI